MQEVATMAGNGWRRWLLFALALALATAGCGSGGGGDGGYGEETFRSEDDGLGCVPACDGSVCGPDGCGGECGVCDGDGVCADGQCVAVDACEASCAGTGCGWVETCNCGDCAGNLVCIDGACKTPAFCNERDFEVAASEARMSPDFDSGFSLYFQARDGAAAPYNLLIVEVDTAAGGPAGPGVVDAAFGGFQEHGVWVYMLTEYQGGGGKGWQGAGYDKLLVPAQGSIEITSLTTDVGGRFTATLHGIQFLESTVDPADDTVAPVSHGLIWCLDDVVLDAEIIQSNPDCIPEGTGTMLGDNIADFSLQNCHGDWVNLHDHCEETEALWLVATAGW